MDSDETLSDVAPEGQPTDEAVAPDLSADLGTESDAAAPDSGQPAPRLYAGKYKSPEELEQSYLDSQREASRMAGELAAYKRAQAQPASSPAEPAYKTLEKQRDSWAAYARDPNLSEDQRENARYQIMLHSEKIAEERAFHRFQETSTRQTATQALEADAQEVFQTYEKDLTAPGSQLYAVADQRFRNLVAAGHPSSDSTRATAILWAATKTGADKTRVVQSDRTSLLNNLNKQARSAQKAGAGTATVVKSSGVTAKQIEHMSDAEFKKYEREQVLGA